MVGTLADTGDSNYMNGSRVVTGPLGGQLQSISVYFKGPLDIVGNRRYGVAIYTDNQGRPGTRLASTNGGTIRADSWNTLPLTIVLAPNTPYWLVTNNNGTGNGVQVLMFESRSNAGVYSTNQTLFGPWPGTFGPSTLADMSFSIYMTLAKP